MEHLTAAVLSAVPFHHLFQLLQLVPVVFVDFYLGKREVLLPIPHLFQQGPVIHLFGGQHQLDAITHSGQQRAFYPIKVIFQTQFLEFLRGHLLPI